MSSGLNDIVKNIVNPNQQAEGKQVEGVQVKVIQVGSSGTQLFGGYINEDALSDKQGRQWMDQIDMMVRSDSVCAEMYDALSLPLLSANWYFIEKEDSELARAQKALFEQVMFHDLAKSFKQTLVDIVTMLRFGYAIFEKTYKPVLGHPELGDYNSISNFGWRSPRTIDRWNMKDGKLKSVTQIAFGDLGKFVDIPSEFLVHFCPKREGDNFEGTSVYRAVFGNWMRRNFFLRMLAAGTEKWAIPTPTLQVPAGLENDQAAVNARIVLEAFVSNSANYIMYPQGWELDFLDAKFDSDKVRKIVDAEGTDMLARILASFLSLGTNGNSGNRALGGTLSDFFGASIQFYADHIIETLERGVFRDLVNLNFGKDTPIVAELKCDGLKELAEETFANILTSLVEKGIVQPDQKLEELVRKKFDLGDIDHATRKQAPAPTEPQAPANDLSGQKDQAGPIG